MSSGIGYNGMPIGCSDDKLPWAREAKNVLDTKYPYGQLHIIVFSLVVRLIYAHILYVYLRSIDCFVCMCTNGQLFVYLSICFG